MRRFTSAAHAQRFLDDYGKLRALLSQAILN